jgi:integrase
VTTKTTDKEIADRRLEKWKEERASGEWVDKKKNPTFVDFEKQYAQWAEKYLTRKTQLNRWRLFSRWTKKKKLGEVNAADIRRFVHHLTELGKANQAVNDYLRDLQALYQHAVDDLGTPSGKNPVKGIKRLTVEKPRPPFLTQPQIDDFLTAAATTVKTCLPGAFSSSMLACASLKSSIASGSILIGKPSC